MLLFVNSDIEYRCQTNHTADITIDTLLEIGLRGGVAGTLEAGRSRVRFLAR